MELVSGQSGHRASFLQIFDNGSILAHRVSFDCSSYEKSIPLNLDEVYLPFGSQSRLTACVSAAHGARKRSDWLDALVVRRCAIHCAALPAALPCLRTRTLPHKLCALLAHVRHFSLSQRTA